jgi:LysM repeat protein
MSAAAIATSGAFALVPMMVSTTSATAGTPPSPSPSSPAHEHAVASIPTPRHAAPEENSPSSPPPTGTTYTVRPGDTLSGIAAGRGLSWTDVWAANKSAVSQPNLLHPGEQLKIPTSAIHGSPSADAASAVTHPAAAPASAHPAAAHTSTAPPTRKITTAAKPGRHALDAPPPSAAKQMDIWLTGYSYQDNTPAGSAKVSHPILHKDAGGTGTYADPITVAVPGKGSGIWKAGSRFYLPTVKRYVIVEDTGASPAPSGQAGHLDMWIGGQGGTKSATDACMDKITGTNVPAEYNPPPTLPVMSGPIWSGGCHIPG